MFSQPKLNKKTTAHPDDKSDPPLLKGWIFRFAIVSYFLFIAIYYGSAFPEGSRKSRLAG